MLAHNYLCPRLPSHSVITVADVRSTMAIWRPPFVHYFATCFRPIETIIRMPQMCAYTAFVCYAIYRLPVRDCVMLTL